MPQYIPAAIEPRWQQYWLKNKVFRTPDPDEPGAAGKPKYYILDMFPYPSGAGLHVGHPEGYTATDILARYKRMRGFHVLHPMGWDAFGLPAEQHAIATGEHPRLNTLNNINNFRRQIQSLGFSYDWDREVDTTDPSYVKWTQWIFLLLYDTWYDPAAKKGRPISELPIPKDCANPEKYRDEHRLAFESEVPVNWCEALGTVLSNEEVIDGKSERGSHPVVRRPLKQWLLRITEYAERLIDDLEPLDWSPAIKQMQRNWIGKSEGATVFFCYEPTVVKRISERGDIVDVGGVPVFTTRPDTLFGATYMVLSPEHPQVSKITTPDQAKAVKEYQQTAARKSDFERTEMAKTKTGVFTGAYAINPVNGKQIPIWIADYVLATYGTGAIMAVPAHDDRDFEFAQQFKLPIVTVVTPTKEWLEKTGSTENDLKEAFTEDGVSVNSEFLNGLGVADAKAKMIDWLGIGTRKVQYKLRDWLFSRQRYWGEPFPILHEVNEKGERTGVTRALTEKDLPVTLPELKEFKPTGSPDGPLAKATDWLTVKLDGKTYRRETNTMPQWAGSCWYYLRYIDAKNPQAFAEAGKLNHWLPVDLYVGGAEHAVLHLLYSRFWHKVLFDRGLVNCPEPFQKLVNQGMILGEIMYRCFFEFDPKIQSEGYSHENVIKGAPISSRVFEGKVAKDFQAEGILSGSYNGNGIIMEYISEELVEKKGHDFVLRSDNSIRVDANAFKMSKSRGNVINPDEVITDYGADALRLYEMFMGPLEAVKPWSTKGVEGVYRFLGRVWRLIIDDGEETKLNAAVENVPPDRDTLRILHHTIKKVGEDTEGMRFNTAISTMMEFVNHMTKLTVRPRAALEPFVLLLAPYAPHIAEELWAALGHPETLAYEAFPAYDPALVKADEIEVPVQVNGKIKTRLTLPADSDKATLEAAALADSRVIEALAGKPPKKVVVVPGKLVNIVA